MKIQTTLERTAPLGELVVAAFDTAAHYTANTEKVARLATAAVMRMLRRARSDAGYLLDERPLRAVDEAMKRVR